MNQNEEISIENDLYRIVSILYENFGEESKDEIKQIIKDFCKDHELNELDVLDKIKGMIKNKNHDKSDFSRE